MQINLIDRGGWERLRAVPDEFISRIQAEEVFIVRQYLSPEAIDSFKSFCIKFSQNSEASWHPCVDGCPDYHRLHNNYPKAYVRSVQHGFYFHPWNQNFAALNQFNDIFELKTYGTGGAHSDFVKNFPSAGIIERIVCHQYPRGGGRQEEHIDPVSPFAKVQTIIQASVRGQDYSSGGLYINDPRLGKVNIDGLAEKGDLILASPGVRHGVAPVDSDMELDWKRTDGRWIIMPIIIHSDHVTDEAIRPKRIT